MFSKLFFAISLIFLSILISAQQVEDEIILTGDKLTGSVKDGESIREVIGNVVLVQGEIKITCNKAIQYLNRNEVELIGDVVLTKDSINIYTPRGFYFGKDKSTYSDTNVTLRDGKINLKAESGYYFTESDRAEFYGNVELVDSVNTLNAMKLFYYNTSDSAIAVENVIFKDENSSIRADSLVHIRERKYSAAFGNVRIDNPENNIVITGQKLVDHGDKNHTLITGNPVLTKIDTSASGELDTLIILSAAMESIDDSSSQLIATDSVRIIRGDFSSLNEYSIFYSDENRIYTYKNAEDKRPPLLWYADSQLLGDTINIYLKDEELNLIDIKNESLVLSFKEGYDNRFDQISGDSLKMHFENQELASTEVFGNVLSIYYIFEDEVANGVLKSSSEKAKLFFKENQISDVRLFGSVKSEYHPEDLITGKEMEFLLPAYIIYEFKPDKSQILLNIPNFK